MVSSVQCCAHEKNQWLDLKLKFVLFSVGAQSRSLRPVCSCDLVHWRENLWGSNSYWLFASLSQYSWETCCKICFHLWESLCSLLFLCFPSLSFCFFSFHRTFFIAAFSGPAFFFSLSLWIFVSLSVFFLFSFFLSVLVSTCYIRDELSLHPSVLSSQPHDVFPTQGETEQAEPLLTSSLQASSFISICLNTQNTHSHSLPRPW